MSSGSGCKELSLSEMRMLVSSVVHMDVSQIALCVVTIPKLKTAVEQLLDTYHHQPANQHHQWPANQHQHQPTNQHQQRQGHHILNKFGRRTKRTAAVTTMNGATHNLSTSHLSENRLSGDNLVMDSVFTEPQHTSAASVEEMTISVDSAIVDTTAPSSIPEYSIVGDRLAVGRPGKSKAKTDARVRYITCRVCHMLFYKRDQYRQHMLIHANDPNIKIYTCNHCPFVTKRRGVFNTHVLRHTGDLPFKCQLCDYGGRQASLLKQHMMNKHPGHDQPEHQNAGLENTGQTTGHTSGDDESFQERLDKSSILLIPSSTDS